jgi:cadmium resistance protein CadD (predicted permease)
MLAQSKHREQVSKFSSLQIVWKVITLPYLDGSDSELSVVVKCCMISSSSEKRFICTFFMFYLILLGFLRADIAHFRALHRRSVRWVSRTFLLILMNLSLMLKIDCSNVFVFFLKHSLRQLLPEQRNTCHIGLLRQRGHKIFCYRLLRKPC